MKSGISMVSNGISPDFTSNSVRCGGFFSGPGAVDLPIIWIFPSFVAMVTLFGSTSWDATYQDLLGYL
jgi:hypothetical protein